MSLKMSGTPGIALSLAGLASVFGHLPASFEGAFGGAYNQPKLPHFQQQAKRKKFKGYMRGKKH